MEVNLNKIITMKISKTIENLKKNNMNAVFVPTKKEALALLESMLVKGETIGTGGSVTLNETGVLNLLRNGNYNFIDKSIKGLTKEQIYDMNLKSLSADTFISSSNAVTENGYLYNVDGRGNRCAAFVFGPKRVIVVAGYNKIVSDIEAAVARVKQTACPANCVRLDVDSYCSKNGKCLSSKIDMPSGSCENSICRSTVITGHQSDPNRFTVILIGEEYGY